MHRHSNFKAVPPMWSSVTKSPQEKVILPSSAALGFADRMYTTSPTRHMITGMRRIMPL